jgi:hypothetical protein
MEGDNGLIRLRVSGERTLVEQREETILKNAPPDSVSNLKRFLSSSENAWENISRKRNVSGL